MNESFFNNVAKREGWQRLLSRLIDVLQINVFIMDPYGKVLLPAKSGRFGEDFLKDISLGFDVRYTSSSLKERFVRSSQFSEARGRYALSCFALPIKNGVGSEPRAYLVAGPVILSQKLNNQEYLDMAKSYGVVRADVMDKIGEIRVVSNLMMNSILDLMHEIVRNNVNELRGKDPLKISSAHFELIEKIKNEIRSRVSIDEVLISLLDGALKISQAECGSIMVNDHEEGGLVMKASRGLDLNKFEDGVVPIGEGICGRAALDEAVFVIRENGVDHRIKGCLKRPEIKQAIVVPLMSKNRVFGVMNLHTKKEGNDISSSVDSLKNLSSLLSSIE
ncbi:GAF domain-containing protein [Candidatus Omnitrophota bacterium]